MHLDLYSLAMKTMTPQNKMVLCTKIQDEHASLTGLIYDKPTIPLYKVEKIGPCVESPFAEGDAVVANAAGTKATIDGIDYWLFNEDNIVGKTL